MPCFCFVTCAHKGVLTEPVEWTGMVRAELDIMSTGRVSAICGLPPSFLPLRRILCILSMITTVFETTPQSSAVSKQLTLPCAVA
jgi:hypothetical protein